MISKHRYSLCCQMYIYHDWLLAIEVEQEAIIEKMREVKQTGLDHYDMNSSSGDRDALPYIWHRRNNHGRVIRVAREAYLRPGLVTAQAFRLNALHSSHILLCGKQ